MRRERRGERKRGRKSEQAREEAILWFMPQMPRTARTGQDRVKSKELFSGIS